MPSLASLLTRDAVVPVEIIERAVERQALDGGDLDTALLEFDAAPENVLAAYRAATFGLAAVGRGELLRIESAVLECVPRELAKRLRVVPIGMHEGRLIVAASTPPSSENIEQLESASASGVDIRIATEARLAVALERNYGIDMSDRLRRLSTTLDARNPGALVDVDPARPSKRFTPPPPMQVLSARHTQRMTDVSEAPADTSVHVARVLSLAPSDLAASDPEHDDPSETRPVRSSRMGSSEHSRSAPPPRLQLNTAEERTLAARLEQARDRTIVEEALLEYVGTRFERVVLFEVRDKHLLARGERPAQDRRLGAHTIEAAMSRGLQAIVLAGQPRVLDLLRDCPGEALPALLDRLSAQPCAILPVALARRVVIALYADRGGKPIAEREIETLGAALHAAGQALERILQARRGGARDARRSQVTAPLPGWEDAVGAMPSALPDVSDDSSVSGSSYLRREIDSEIAGAALRSLPPPRSTDRPPPLVPLSPPTGASSDEASPTMVLPRASERPTSTSKRPNAHAVDQPRHPSQEHEPSHAQRPSDRPPGAARLLSHSPKGAGSYALRDADEALIDGRADLSGRSRSAPPPRSAREESWQRPEKTAERDPRRETAREHVRPKRAADPRREGDQRPMRAEIISMPPAVRESLRPASAESSGSLNIDLSGEAERLVERLAASTPGEEEPLIHAIVRLGQAGIDAIVRRFPGPSWAARGQIHKRGVSARDLGPLPRALWAFDDNIVPAVMELLEAQHADSRLYAAVLAGDRVHADFLWPLYRRLFDAEGAVRLLVAETLPLYRNASGFEEVLKSLRKRGSDERETLQNRLAALEAMSNLRDVGSIETLAELAAHTDRQYSLPAQRALVAITGQDFGDQARKWRAWYSKHADRHRVQWLIESLTHSDERVRATAGHELQKLTQVYYGFVASAPKRDRERAQDRYRAWWAQEGKAQFGVDDR